MPDYLSLGPVGLILVGVAWLLAGIVEKVGPVVISWRAAKLAREKFEHERRRSGKG